MTIDITRCRRFVLVVLYTAAASTQMSCELMKHCKIRSALEIPDRPDNMQGPPATQLEDLRMKLVCPL